MSKRITLFLIFLFLTALPACGNSNSALIIAGSTSVQPYAELLAEEFSLLHPESEIDVQGGGSSAGITASETGAADIGMSSRSLKEPEQFLWSVEIAKDGLAIIVNPGNPVGGLTIEQIRGVYSGQIENWKDIGGSDAKIHIIAREEGSGTRSAFDDLVMASEEIFSKAIVQDSNGAVRQLVSSDPDSIGFVSLGLVDGSVKALKLDGVDASWDNIVNGSYKLFRPFLFVSNGEPSGEAKRFIDFTLSAEGRKLLTDEGLIPPS